MNKKDERQIVGLKEVVVVVLLSVLTLAVTLVCAIPFVASPQWSVWGGYTLAALISGPIFILMISKAPKTGTAFLFFFVKALYVLMMGQIPTALVYCLGGVICELVLMKGGYKSPFRLALSYALHSVIFGIGTFTPLFMNAAGYAKQLLDAGMDQGIVNTMVYDLTMPGFLAIATIALIGGSAVGVLIGLKLLKKHFQPAGVTSSSLV